MSIVSQDFSFEPEEEAIIGNCYRTIIPSQQQSYQLGDRILIELPHTHQTMMNTQASWLNLILNANLTGTNVVSNTTDIHLSSIGIFSCINEINLISNSSGYIQQIRNHQQIIAFLLANNSDMSSTFASSINSGVPLTSGSNSRINDPIAISASGGIPEQKYSIPLLGLLSDSMKQLPIGMINDNLTIEIVLCSDVRNIFFSGKSSDTTEITGGTISVTAEFDADMITLSDNSYRKVLDASKNENGIISWNSSQFHATNNTVSISNLDAGSKSIIQFEVGGVRPSQLTQIFHAGFPSALGSGDMWEFGNYQSEDFRVRLGSHVYPQQYIKNSSEFKNSVNDALSQTANTLLNQQTDFNHNKMNYRQLASTTVHTSTLSGGVAYNWEKFYDTGQGIDHKGKQLTIEVSVQTSGVTAINPIQACTIKRFSVLYSISPNGDFSVSY